MWELFGIKNNIELYSSTKWMTDDTDPVMLSIKITDDGHEFEMYLCPFSGMQLSEIIIDQFDLCYFAPRISGFQKLKIKDQIFAAADFLCEKLCKVQPAKNDV